MRILGIDPGLGITGYGVIKANSYLPQSEAGGIEILEAGVIKSPLKYSLAQRLSHIYTSIKEIIHEYKPADLVLEKLYSHYKHQMTAIAMAHARGVIALCAGEFPRLRLVDYSAKRIRLALTGNGNASKIQVQRTVQSLFNLKKLPTPADVSDALALAIAHVYIISAGKTG